MPIETEHKFLVKHDLWEKVKPRKGEHIRQGYLQNETDQTVRVRTKDKRAYITIKGKTEGASRDEYEFRIPFKEANELLDKFCGNVIDKIRYKLRYRRRTWEVDVFEGKNLGLVMAEIELENEEQSYKIPPWTAQNVTGDERYYNSYLVNRPFSEWPSDFDSY